MLFVKITLRRHWRAQAIKLCGGLTCVIDLPDIISCRHWWCNLLNCGSWLTVDIILYHSHWHTLLFLHACTVVDKDPSFRTIPQLIRLADWLRELSVSRFCLTKHMLIVIFTPENHRWINELLVSRTLDRVAQERYTGPTAQLWQTLFLFFLTLRTIWWLCLRFNSFDGRNVNLFFIGGQSRQRRCLSFGLLPILLMFVPYAFLS